MSLCPWWNPFVSISTHLQKCFFTLYITITTPGLTPRRPTPAFQTTALLLLSTSLIKGLESTIKTGGVGGDELIAGFVFFNRILITSLLSVSQCGLQAVAQRFDTGTCLTCRRRTQEMLRSGSGLPCGSLCLYCKSKSSLNTLLFRIHDKESCFVSLKLIKKKMQVQLVGLDAPFSKKLYKSSKRKSFVFVCLPMKTLWEELVYINMDIKRKSN